MFSWWLGIDKNLEACAGCDIGRDTGSGDHKGYRDRLATGSSADCDYDLDNCDIRSLGSVSRATSSAMSEGDDLDDDPLEEVSCGFISLYLIRLLKMLC